MGLERADGGGGAGPVFLHIGLPKTGTTFLQRVLRRNRELLRSHGVLYPGDSPATQFHAAIELRRSHRYWGVTPEQVDGTWERLCEEARQFPGPTVMGHEILSAAQPAQIRRVADDLADVELHVVVTVRDIGRQLPAWWQENAKNGSREDFATTMAERVLPEWDADRKKTHFWRSQDLVDVLRRWGAVVPPERTHVVLGPPPGADPQLLWRRFAEAVGIPGDLDVDPGSPSNESLGVVEIALLRATNEALAGRLVQPDYGPVVKHWFTQSVLSPRTSRRPALTADWQERVEALTARWTGHLEASGVRLHGSLDDLRPVLAPPGELPPDLVTAEELAELGPKAIAELLLEVARLRRELRECRARPHLSPAVLRESRGVRLLSRARDRAKGLVRRVG
jgi:hypothetical protein